MRGGELVKLQVYDVEAQREVIRIRHGKGNKDRVVPVGQRALTWLEKYTQDIRPELVSQTDQSSLFVSVRGRVLCRNNLSSMVKDYLRGAGIAARGSCHLIRHTTATLMLENGADLRSLQQLLGHESLVLSLLL